MGHRTHRGIALSFALAGAVVAHVLIAGESIDRHDERAPMQGRGLWPWLAWVAAMVVLAATARRLRTPTSRFRAVALAPFVGWMLLELVERLTGHESAPFGSLPEAHVWTGLLVQVPFALAIYCIARALIAAARSLIRRVVGRAVRDRRRPQALPRPVGVVLLKPDPRSRGSPQRGPPLPC